MWICALKKKMQTVQNGGAVAFVVIVEYVAYRLQIVKNIILSGAGVV